MVSACSDAALLLERRAAALTQQPVPLRVPGAQQICCAALLSPVARRRAQQRACWLASSPMHGYVGSGGVYRRSQQHASAGARERGLPSERRSSDPPAYRVN